MSCPCRGFQGLPKQVKWDRRPGQQRCPISAACASDHSRPREASLPPHCKAVPRVALPRELGLGAQQHGKDHVCILQCHGLGAEGRVQQEASRSFLPHQLGVRGARGHRPHEQLVALQTVLLFFSVCKPLPTGTLSPCHSCPSSA